MILRQPHIVCIVETWMISQIQISCLDLIGTGMVVEWVYVCNFLSCKQLISNEIHDLELMAMSVNTLP